MLKFVTLFIKLLGAENCIPPPICQIENDASFFAWPPHGVFLYLIKNTTSIELELRQKIDEGDEFFQLSLTNDQIDSYFRDKSLILQRVFPKPSMLKYENLFLEIY
jgi:hypothetical protein